MEILADANPADTISNVGGVAGMLVSIALLPAIWWLVTKLNAKDVENRKLSNEIKEVMTTHSRELRQLTVDFIKATADRDEKFGEMLNDVLKELQETREQGHLANKEMMDRHLSEMRELHGMIVRAKNKGVPQ